MVPSEFYIKTLSVGSNIVAEINGINGLVNTIVTEIFADNDDDFSVQIALFKKGESLIETKEISDKLNFVGEQYYKECYFNNIESRFKPDDIIQVVAFVEGQCSNSGFVYDTFNKLRPKELGYSAKVIPLVSE